MELLAFELIQIAKKAGIDPDKITRILGQKVKILKPAGGEDLSWRDQVADSIPERNLSLLEKDFTQKSFSKISKRRVSQSFQLFMDSDSEEITLLGATPNNTLRIEAFSDFRDFGKYLFDPFRKYHSLPIDQDAIRQLSKQEFVVFLLLIELFLDAYPEPNPDWEPESELTFDADLLLGLAKKVSQKPLTHTWWGHFSKLYDFGQISSSEIQTGIAMLLAKGLLGESEDEDQFFIGNELTWMIRCMAWWDRGFSLSDPDTQTQVMLIQATGLFMITIDRDQDFGLVHADADSLQRFLGKYLQQLQTENGQSSKGKSDSSSAPKFCHNCGDKLTPGAKFCINCGTKIG